MSRVLQFFLLAQFLDCASAFAVDSVTVPFDRAVGDVREIVAVGTNDFLILTGDRTARESNVEILRTSDDDTREVRTIRFDNIEAESLVPGEGHLWCYGALAVRGERAGAWFLQGDQGLSFVPLPVGGRSIWILLGGGNPAAIYVRAKDDTARLVSPKGIEETWSIRLHGETLSRPRQWQGLRVSPSELALLSIRNESQLVLRRLHEGGYVAEETRFDGRKISSFAAAARNAEELVLAVADHPSRDGGPHRILATTGDGEWKEIACDNEVPLVRPRIVLSGSRWLVAWLRRDQIRATWLPSECSGCDERIVGTHDFAAMWPFHVWTAAHGAVGVLRQSDREIHRQLIE